MTIALKFAPFQASQVSRCWSSQLLNQFHSIFEFPPLSLLAKPNDNGGMESLQPMTIALKFNIPENTVNLWPYLVVAIISSNCTPLPVQKPLIHPQVRIPASTKRTVKYYKATRVKSH
ncbi:hypothetical protein V5799_033777 [Amblyomma americanum]|uniref:Uncharacterized protein n=1 Tax=Amblyomma americanum TaxID=6943 RepID=A0AAQ4DMC7_AMBAM